MQLLVGFFKVMASYVYDHGDEHGDEHGDVKSEVSGFESALGRVRSVRTC